jgi:hypothetical protein
MHTCKPGHPLWHRYVPAHLAPVQCAHNYCASCGITGQCQLYKPTFYLDAAKKCQKVRVHLLGCSRFPAFQAAHCAALTARPQPPPSTSTSTPPLPQCAVANCATCEKSGKCVACKPSFFLDGQKRCTKTPRPPPPRALSRPPPPRVRARPPPPRPRPNRKIVPAAKPQPGFLLPPAFRKGAPPMVLPKRPAALPAGCLARSSVKGYKLVGNGVTDDARALRAANQALPILYFPPGVYRLRSDIILTKTVVMGASPVCPPVRPPASPPACLPACPPACPPACLPASHADVAAVPSGLPIWCLATSPRG